MDDKIIYRMDDDSDMKIAGVSDSAASDSAMDPESIDAYDRMRRSGELSRARRLGASLADCIEDVFKSLAIKSSDETVLLHSKLLVIFSAVAAMESDLPNPMLARTALNVFYDTLKKDSPELYDSMSVTGAVTFYYLEYRKLGVMPADIGGKFAMLCGREEDDALMSLGLDVFTRSFDHVRKIIDGMSFSG